jgi:endonuclease/exonuclease/phosphatase family metal-dependent hydrolase
VPELVVSSFNVHWGRGLPRDGYPPFDVAAACRGLSADVLVVQEAWVPDQGPSGVDAIAEATGLGVVATAPMARVSLGERVQVLARGGDPAAGGAGTWTLAVLSRHPVRSTETVWLPDLRFDKVARPLLVSDLDVAGAPLTVVAAHLPHLQVGSLLLTPRLRAALPAVDQAAVLAGDMNMWSPFIVGMTPRGWRRAVRGRTWPSPRPHSQIDHLLVTPPVRVLGGDVVDLVASDHRPVRARLAL